LMAFISPPWLPTKTYRQGMSYRFSDAASSPSGLSNAQAGYNLPDHHKSTPGEDSIGIRLGLTLVPGGG